MKVAYIVLIRSGIMRNRAIYAALALGIALLCAGCDEDSDSSSAPSTEYHTFTLENYTTYAPKQLIRMEVTPYGTVDTITENFVLNVGYTKQVKVAIPEAGPYTIQVYAADGQSMWWDNITLELPGETTCTISCGGSNPINFWGSCAGIDESGTDMFE